MYIIPLNSFICVQLELKIYSNGICLIHANMTFPLVVSKTPPVHRDTC